MGAGHPHGSPSDSRARLWVAFGLTFVVLIAQAVGTVLTGSLALLTDTAHMLTDVSGLAMALVAATLILRPPSSKRTWGFRRAEVIAALAQAALLLVVGVYSAVEGVRRLFDPPEVPGSELLVFGVIGLAANIVAILVLASSRNSSLNMRAAFLEVLNDALGSVGVIVAGILITTTGFLRADPLAGLVIAALIVPRAVKLIRESIAVLMEFTPAGLDLDDVRRHVLELEHVIDVHDLHASMVGTGLPTLTGHIVVRDECFTDGHAVDVLSEVKECVAAHFDVAIEHATFQIETQSIRESESDDVTHP
ncbi:MAG TPA: cation diffusion facilitator family transporter [Candidatus Microbacterium stercoravium]|uniref:Cation diffusion facilitator family transporter n=1 Tax=Candidatus Microbacterium stercoravium TaxID=2838697 RepID=A0A9D2KHM9_9MICO|nr:cation diffusion facilitator family transporter [Candidatus Microbacterium stercoravium]